MRSPNVRTIATPFEAFYQRKPILSHLRIVGFIAYAIKRIQKKLVDRSEKCVLLGYEGEHIFRLYNLTKKIVVRANSVHFVKKRPLVVDPEEETEAHEPSNKRQRLTVPASAAGEALNKQRITNISEDVKPKDVAPITKTATKPSAASRPPAPIRPRPNFP